jgi:hypothetical protein
MNMTVRVLAFALVAMGCGCSKAEPEQELHRADAILSDLNAYAETVVAATKGNIFGPTDARLSNSDPLSYVIKFETNDPALLAREDADTNEVSFALNSALTEGWSRRFCSGKLKGIMAKHGIFLVSGHLTSKGKTQSISACMR